MSGYSTRHRTLILAFLQRHTGRSFTAGEVHQQLSRELGREMLPARSTVYRIMRRLAHEGAVMRLPRQGTGAYAYQMEGHSACDDTLHLHCKACGRLTHLEADQARRLTDTVRKQLRFELDSQQTTLYGKCEHCAGQPEEQHA